ncbi:hypothetical protein [Brevundimonas sp. NPDC058933]|uniref:hypothetical protein n=1 Tax=Brevundimonas sp. NPDC058933 TaxID=3346673 RepID=UPI003BEEECF5
MFTRDEILAYEAMRAEQLFAIARTMTALGLSGHDPDDERVSEFLERGAKETGDDVDDLIAWIAVNKRGWGLA